MSADSLSIDVHCLPETRIQDPSTVVEPISLSVSTGFCLHTSGDPEAAATGSTGFGVVLGHRAEGPLLEWLPVDSRLCEVSGDPGVMVHSIYGVEIASTPRAEYASLNWIPVSSRLFAGSIKVCAFGFGKWRLLAVSVPSTNSSCGTEKDSLRQYLLRLLRSARCSDIVILVGGVTAKVGLLSPDAVHLKGRLGVNAHRTVLSRVSNLLSEFERVPPCSLEGCAPDGRAIELNVYLPSSPQVTNPCSALRQADCDNESDDGSDTASGCDDSSISSAHDAHLDESKSDECTDHDVRNHQLVEELPSQQATSDSPPE
ncbi:hypothetical protein CLF_103189 [Clonorchis sinensis]|uniref:Uncharacterized protein n=1 Tax=Clonorchis sinensis TaxID=79923 RepID=G7Y9A4_CLOSI|nr:hypothetical protein CLF_103189 [Clonorchis sinensis]